MSRTLQRFPLWGPVISFAAPTLIIGAIAQLGERYTGSVEVGGSIPPGSTNDHNGKRFWSKTKVPIV